MTVKTSMSSVTGYLACLAAALPFASSAQAKEVELPPYTQAYEPTAVDERGLWMKMDEHERILKKSPLLVQDEKLNAYVRRVLCKTVGEDRCASARIYIVEDPFFNASMAPNGLMQIRTGLLLRTHNEAELGAILGHEFAHFELRHSLRAFEKQRGATDALAWLTVASGITNIGMIGAQYSILGSFFQYNRDQEEDADLLGLSYLGKSQYPSNAAAIIWQNLMAESDATYAGRKRKKKHQYTAGFFASHPTNFRRATYLAKESEKIGDRGESNPEGHFAAIKEHFPRMLDAQIKLNDFGGTEYLLAELSDLSGWTPELLFARGEMYKTRGNPRDLVSATQFYREAIALGYGAPVVHRNLGLALLRGGSQSEASPELRKYLRLMPDAQDYSVIRTLVPESESQNIQAEAEIELEEATPVPQGTEVDTEALEVVIQHSEMELQE